MGQARQVESEGQMSDQNRTRIEMGLGLATTIALALIWVQTSTSQGPSNEPSEEVLQTATDCIVHQGDNGTMTHAILKIPNNPDYIVPLTPRTLHLNNADLRGIGYGLRVTENIFNHDAQSGQQTGYLSCNFAGIIKTAKNPDGEFYSIRYNADGTRLYSNVPTPQTLPLAQN